MANTFTLISTQVVPSGGAASITFSSIPATYTDLKILISGRTSRASDGDYILPALNGSATYADAGIYLKGYSTTVETGTVNNNYGACPSTNNTTNSFGNMQIYIPDYQSTIAKTISYENAYADRATVSATDGYGTFIWNTGSASTSAVTSITLASRFANFVQYSSASLYGIKNA